MRSSRALSSPPARSSQSDYHPETASSSSPVAVQVTGTSARAFKHRPFCRRPKRAHQSRHRHVPVTLAPCGAPSEPGTWGRMRRVNALGAGRGHAGPPVPRHPVLLKAPDCDTMRTRAAEDLGGAPDARKCPPRAIPWCLSAPLLQDRPVRPRMWKASAEGWRSQPFRGRGG